MDVTILKKLQARLKAVTTLANCIAQTQVIKMVMLVELLAEISHQLTAAQ